MSARKAWLWRAWNAKRERICDCGIAMGDTKSDAESVAWMCLGGPHQGEVVEMQLEEVRQ